MDNKLNASQRLDKLEAAIPLIDGKFAGVFDYIQGLSNNLDILNKRIEAIVNLANNKGLIGASEINDLIINMNLQELEEKTLRMEQEGFIKEDVDGVVNEKSLVVGRELDQEGNVIISRLQFALESEGVADFIRQSLIGKKVGDIVDIKDSKYELLKVYSFNLK